MRFRTSWLLPALISVTLACVTFTTLGTYEYDCAVHGQAMSGTIVVQ